MTSRVSFISLIIDNFKRRLPSFVICLVLFIFTLPVNFLMTVQGLFENIEKNLASIADAQKVFVSSMNHGNTAWLYIVCIFGLILAFNGFKYLYDKSAVDLFHSIPVKREKQFLARYISGALIFIISYVFSNALTLLLGVLKGVCTADAIAAFGTSLFLVVFGFLNFYTVGVLVVTLTGTMLTGVLMTCAFLGFPIMIRMAVYEMLNAFVPTFVFGNQFYDSWGRFTYISPVLSFMYAGEEALPTSDYIGRVGVTARYIVIPLIIVFVLAFICYKLRPSESAGNAVSFEKFKKPWKILVVAIFSLTIGLAFMDMTSTYSEIWMVFGLIFGGILFGCIVEVIYWAEFKKLFRNFAMTGIGLAIALVATFAIKLDLFKIDRALPAESEIENYSVAFDFINDGSDGITRDKFSGSFVIPGGIRFTKTDMKITNFKPILEIAELHNEYAGKSSGQADIVRATVRYKLKNGQTINKQYSVPLAEIKEPADEIFLTKEYKEAEFEVLKEDMKYNEMVFYNPNGREEAIPSAEHQKILDTYRKELYTLSINDIIEKSVGSQLHIYTDKNSYSLDINHHFQETISLLKSLGYTPEINLQMKDINCAEVTSYYYEGTDLRDLEETHRTITNREQIQEMLNAGYCAQILGNYYCGPYRVGADVLFELESDNEVNSTEVIWRISKDKLPNWLKQ